jgi:hypothetical protein
VRLQRMIRKSVKRFSDKIMRKRQAMPQLPPQLSAASQRPLDTTGINPSWEGGLKAVTREPGDLLPAMVMRERVGRGAPKRCESRRVCRIRAKGRFSGNRV